MEIKKDTLVSIHYTLKNDDGEVVDTSVGAQPLIFLQGNGFLLPKFEEYLEGKTTGDKVSFTLPPEDAYGPYDENAIAKVPRSNFEFEGEIPVGAKFQADTPMGPSIVTVTEVTDEFITVDANHELAGKTLHFDVEIVEAREATEDEIKQMTSGGCGCGCEGGCGGDCGEGCGCSGGCEGCGN